MHFGERVKIVFRTWGIQLLLLSTAAICRFMLIDAVSASDYTFLTISKILTHWDGWECFVCKVCKTPDKIQERPQWAGWFMAFGWSSDAVRIYIHLRWSLFIVSMYLGNYFVKNLSWWLSEWRVLLEELWRKINILRFIKTTHTS